MNLEREQQWLRFGRLTDTLRCIEAKHELPRTNLAPLLDEFFANPEDALTALERHLLSVVAAT